MRKFRRFAVFFRKIKFLRKYKNFLEGITPDNEEKKKKKEEKKKRKEKEN